VVLLTLIVQAPGGGPVSRGAAIPDAEARRWFEDAKFGRFVHWGVYSLVGKGESVMEHDKIPIAEYEKLPPRFNPTEFDADRWVKDAKDAGQKYLTITAKHHDGFCMFDSALTRYDIVDATPYGKDPLKDLAFACRKHGIKLFFYYSLLDWHHPDYFPRGKTGLHAGREDRGDWSRYLAYYQGQVRELCTNYGEIGGVWFDGVGDRPDADWGLEETYKIVHDLQPGALVANNHRGTPRPGEDIQVFGRDLPDGDKDKDRPGAAPTLARETCLTINRSWGYNAGDRDYKSPELIIEHLLGAAGRGANLLLNVGPRPDGTIGPEFTERLQEIGRWLDKNGATVYGTRRGPVPPQPWGVSVSKEGSIYLHVIKPDVPVKLPRALLTFDPWLEGKAERLSSTSAGNEIVIAIPEKERMPIDTIVVLRPKGYAR
jgi:alpha-L-fucosidase